MLHCEMLHVVLTLLRRIRHATYAQNNVAHLSTEDIFNG